jgi:DNA polymerase-3 subunit alpha
LLSLEREMLGLYVSDHPLFGVEALLAQHTTLSVSALAEAPDGTVATIGGLVAQVQAKTTRRTGERWAIVTLEDLGGVIDLYVWPKTFPSVAHVLTEDAVVLARVRVERRDEETRIAVLEMTVPDISAAHSGPLMLFIPENRINPTVMTALREVLATHPGASPVHLTLVMPDREIELRTEDTLRVRPTAALYADLKALLGPSCLEPPAARSA